MAWGSGDGGLFCYPALKKTKRAALSPQTKGLTLGLEGFAWISAVEGIKLSAESLEMFAEFDRRGLSDEERRRFIFYKHKAIAEAHKVDRKKKA
jgi:hypothetical protein